MQFLRARSHQGHVPADSDDRWLLGATLRARPLCLNRIAFGSTPHILCNICLSQSEAFSLTEMIALKGSSAALPPLKLIPALTYLERSTLCVFTFHAHTKFKLLLVCGRKINCPPQSGCT